MALGEDKGRTDAKHERIARRAGWALFVVAVFLITLASGELPCSQQRAPSLRTVALYGVGLTLVLLHMAQVRRTPKGGAVLKLILAVVVGGGAVMTASELEHGLKKKRWNMHGEVRAKYRSTNHGARTIVLAHEGSADTYEGVAAPFWDRVVVGDRVSKPECLADGSLNGVPIRIVP